jgi:hypothetical protein
MYKANYGNNIRRKGNSDTYKYRCEAPIGTRPWAVTHFAHLLHCPWNSYRDIL